MSATEATIQTFAFKIIAPKNETITVTMGDGTVYTVKGTDTESVTKDDLRIAYGTKWSATVSAEDVTAAGTTIGQELFSGVYNTKSYTVQIPNDVTQITFAGHYGPAQTVDLSQTYYVNDKAYKLNKPPYQINAEVTPGSVVTLKADAVENASVTDIGTDFDYTDGWWITASKVNTSSSSTSTTAGNLIVNDVDTGSTTGSGTVTGIVSVSAGVANTPQIDIPIYFKTTYDDSKLETWDESGSNSDYSWVVWGYKYNDKTDKNVSYNITCSYNVVYGVGTGNESENNSKYTFNYFGKVNTNHIRLTYQGSVYDNITMVKTLANDGSIYYKGDLSSITPTDISDSSIIIIEEI